MLKIRRYSPSKPPEFQTRWEGDYLCSGLSGMWWEKIAEVHLEGGRWEGLLPHKGHPLSLQKVPGSSCKTFRRVLPAMSRVCDPSVEHSISAQARSPSRGIGVAARASLSGGGAGRGGATPPPRRLYLPRAAAPRPSTDFLPASLGLFARSFFSRSPGTPANCSCISRPWHTTAPGNRPAGPLRSHPA